MRSELVYKAHAAMNSRFQLCIVTAKITRGLHRGVRIQDSMNQALKTVEQSGDRVIGRSGDGCPVCGSATHVHCSTGCESCDDPSSPHPVFAETFCRRCKQSLCLQCFADHSCAVGRA
jgi:hypothetical protein